MNQFKFRKSHYFREGDHVTVLPPIGKDFTDDKEGVVLHRDGEYIYVRLNKSRVECELYSNELELRDAT